MNSTLASPDSGQIRVRNYARALQLLWLLLVCSSLAWNYYQGQVAANASARTSAHSAYDRDNVYREWSEAWGGVYVPVTEFTPPNAHLPAPMREVTLDSGERLALINHAYLTRLAYDLAEIDYGLRGHMTRLKPLRKENAPDSWERKALIAAGGDSNDYASIDMVDGVAYMRLLHPLVMEQSCVKCHDDDASKIGQMIGGISVGVPMKPFWEAERVRMQHLAGAHGLLWIAGAFGMSLGARRMNRQVKERERAERKVRESEAQLRELNRQVAKAHDLLADNFGRYVDPRVVTQIMESAEPVRLGGERTFITVLMSDIRGFTDMSERMEAEELVEFLNRYFSAMAEIVFEQDGTLDKFMGDAVIALFGAPVRHADDPRRAIKAALAMMEKVRQLNHMAAASGGCQIEIGVGISTGDMVVGNIGSPRRHDYTVIGRDINIAKRLESLTKELASDILISESTYQLVKGRINAIDHGLQSIRGIEERIHVYGVTGLADEA